jgi:hypothetical protein
MKPLARSPLPRLARLLALAAALACSGSDAAGPAGLEGTYTLRTVNGSPLPADAEVPVSDGLARLPLVSATLVLRAAGTDGGTYAFTWNFDPPAGYPELPTRTRTSGTYVREASTLQMRPDDPGAATFHVVIDGGRLIRSTFLTGGGPDDFSPDVLIFER